MKFPFNGIYYRLVEKDDKGNYHFCESNHVKGTAERPRLNVFEDNAHIYAQIIDDDKQVTLTAASSRDKFFDYFPCNIDTAAVLVGEVIAKRARAAGITEVVVDCKFSLIYSNYALRLLLMTAREAGLKF